MHDTTFTRLGTCAAMLALVLLSVVVRLTRRCQHRSQGLTQQTEQPPQLNGRNAILQPRPMTHTTLRACSRSRIFIDAIKRPRLGARKDRTYINLCRLAGGVARSDVSWYDQFISSSTLPPFSPAAATTTTSSPSQALGFADNRF